MQTAAIAPLPDELVLLIIGFVPIGHILPFRTVSRFIKQHIDNSVLHSYLYRTHLFALIGWAPVTEASADESTYGHRLLKFSFSHLEDFPEPAPRNALWDGSRAVFRPDADWFKEGRTLDNLLAPGIQTFEIRSWPCWKDYHPEPDQQADWFIQLDHAALDLDSGITTYWCDYWFGWNPGYFKFDDAAMTVTLGWRIVLRNLLVMETEITRRIREQDGPDPLYHFDDSDEEELIAEVNPAPTYTWGPIEDYIRQFRRDNFFRYLDCGHCKDDEVGKGILRSPKTFGRSQYSGWGPESVTHKEVKSYEESAMKIIMELREKR
jgi:hypothetical protein